MEQIARSNTELLQEIRDEVRAFRTEIRDEAQAFRTEIQEEAQAFRAEVNAHFDGMSIRLDNLRTDLSDVRAETHTRFEGMRAQEACHFWLTFSAIVTSFLMLAALIAKAHHWI